jgi:oligosaccharyltransferase complex subunit delta (ribophorin II)
MRIPRSLSPSLLIAGAAIVNAASSSWGFSEAIVSLHGKGAGGGFKDKSVPITISESLRGFRSASAIGLDISNLLTCCLLFRLSDHVPLSKPIVLGSNDLKIVLTAVEGKTPKRPHQALLLVKDVETGLETSFPFTVKDDGKGKVNLVRDIALLLSIYH